MKKPCATFAIAAMWLVSAPLSAGDHLVTRGAIGARLSDAASQRARELASLDELLASSRAGRVAARAGVDIGQVRGSLSQLSDSDLRDLSRRAAALESNPVAGHYDEAADLMVLLIVVAVAAAVALAIINNA